MDKDTNKKAKNKAKTKAKSRQIAELDLEFKRDLAKKHMPGQKLQLGDTVSMSKVWCLSVGVLSRPAGIIKDINSPFEKDSHVKVLFEDETEPRWVAVANLVRVHPHYKVCLWED